MQLSTRSRKSLRLDSSLYAQRISNRSRRLGFTRDMQYVVGYHIGEANPDEKEARGKSMIKNAHFLALSIARSVLKLDILTGDHEVFLRRKNTKIGGLRRTGAYEMLLLSEKPSHMEQLQTEVGEVLNCQPHAEPIATSDQTEDSITEIEKI
ncbi:hypothetical protein TWF569_001422 [Orbilia oligospora]|nr:hypothetical protein TWF706_009492 [Orbilia oligospora]KAF3146947.1 hypothetical protein TWF594_003001 [Orbilia oligospora]KAF3153821.1 hypothetical protein TWF569_001422 [Orbilia oligospora]